jgi:hypothetical protein
MRSSDGFGQFTGPGPKTIGREPHDLVIDIRQPRGQNNRGTAPRFESDAATTAAYSATMAS